MLKMDFLGLTTLTVIDDALKSIKQRTGSAPDLDAATLDDPEVYRMLRAGKTAGVFQFESPLATDMLKSIRADRFDDLVASNALMRPGPLDAGMHKVYIKRGEEPVTYILPELKQILETTYGVITYQEQVMRIAQTLAGISLAEADVLRKAVGKKRSRADPRGAGQIRREVCRPGARPEDHRQDRRAAADVRALRFSEGPLGSVLDHRLSHGVAQGALPRRFHGGAAVVADRRHRQRRQVHQRDARSWHRGASARCERIGIQVHGHRRKANSLWAWRDSKRRTVGDRFDHRCASRAARSSRCPISPIASIFACATSASSMRSFRRARSTRWAVTGRSSPRSSTRRCAKHRSSRRKRRRGRYRCSVA